MYWTLELASYLEDAPWPATKDELIDYSIRSGAPLEVVENLQELEGVGPPLCIDSTKTPRGLPAFALRSLEIRSGLFAPVLNDVETDPLALGQRPEIGLVHRSNMYEHVA